MTNTTTRRAIPTSVLALSFEERWKWARTSARLSHDRICELMQRSNRSHLIQIEKGNHTPRTDLRDAYADATGVPRDLFAEGGNDAESVPFRGGRRPTRPSDPPRSPRNAERMNEAA